MVANFCALLLQLIKILTFHCLTPRETMKCRQNAVTTKQALKIGLTRGSTFKANIAHHGNTGMFLDVEMAISWDADPFQQLFKKQQKRPASLGNLGNTWNLPFPTARIILLFSVLDDTGMMFSLRDDEV